MPQYSLISDDAIPYALVYVDNEEHTVCVQCCTTDENDSEVGCGDILKPVGESALKLETSAFPGIVIESFTGAVEKLGAKSGHEGEITGADGTIYRVYSNAVRIIKDEKETDFDLPSEFFDDDENENFHVDCICVGAHGEVVFVWSNDWRGNHSVGVLSTTDNEFVFVAELGECTVASVTIDWRGNILLLGEWMDGTTPGNPAVIVLDTGAENPAEWNEMRDLKPNDDEDDDDDADSGTD